MKTFERAERGGEEGFTLIEMLVAMTLMAIMAGMAVVSVQGVMTTNRGDTAMMQVASVLRTGREAAIAQRRSIDVEFVDPNRIKLVRNDIPSGTTVISDVVFENGVQFHRSTEIPDTPDKYGAGSAVDFDDKDTIRFQPDGTLTDKAGVPINGTVFTGLEGQDTSARAVTVTGSSGRAQSFRWTGSRWEAR